MCFFILPSGNLCSPMLRVVSLSDNNHFANKNKVQVFAACTCHRSAVGCRVDWNAGNIRILSGKNKQSKHGTRTWKELKLNIKHKKQRLPWMTWEVTYHRDENEQDSETQGCRNVQELKELNIHPTITMNRIRWETKTTEYKYKENNQETML